MSAAKVLAGLYGILGIVAAMYFAVVGEIDGQAIPLPLVLLVPVIHAGIGFLAGGILAALYNLVAGWTGGVELEFSDDKTEW